MALEVGSRLGHYDVTALIGEGGMGQVYQATDTKLNRQVALKILPEAFATDPDRLARFQREAQVLASLNHPGIAAIYGIEEQDDTRALVLELVEGPTLADRIAQGPIPVDEALPIAKQIAEALEAAHGQGVIHRDLKPANIKLKPDGTVKVLDFGLAKAFEAVGGNPDESPTVTAVATSGVILGTAAYMSPEQARGKPVDKRADIWAFGAVLYEMLSGQRPFSGRDASETRGAVLQLDPDWEALPADAPQHLNALLKRCLEKEPKQRVHDVADARLAMEGAFGEGLTVHTPTSSPTWRSGLAVAGGILGGVGLMMLLDPATPPPEVRRWSLSLMTQARDPSVAVSPNGQTVVFDDDRSGVSHLFRRRLDQLEAEVIPGTENGRRPFFSADGQRVGFGTYVSDTNDRLAGIRLVDLAGGPPVSVNGVQEFLGAAWGADGALYFAGAATSDERYGLWSVSASGGDPTLIAAVDQEQEFRFPPSSAKRSGPLVHDRI